MNLNHRKKAGFLPKLLTACILLFACLLATALGMLLRDLLRSRAEQTAFRELAALVEAQQTQLRQELPETGAPEPVAEPESPYRVLSEKNPDFAAWIRVPGTSIDYPVMYTPEDAQKYLYKAFDGSDSPSGTPFVGAYGDLDSTKCIIYGHNMKDGTMFHDLLKYGEKTFWQENPTFTIHTLEGARTYEIFSAVRTRVLTTGESGLRFYRLEDGVESWLLEQSLYDTGIVLQEGDSVVILTTCSYHTEEGRFLVAGRLAQ